jgi:hypothetical protein
MSRPGFDAQPDGLLEDNRAAVTADFHDIFPSVCVRSREKCDVRGVVPLFLISVDQVSQQGLTGRDLSRRSFWREDLFGDRKGSIATQTNNSQAAVARGRGHRNNRIFEHNLYMINRKSKTVNYLPL